VRSKEKHLFFFFAMEGSSFRVRLIRKKRGRKGAKGKREKKRVIPIVELRRSGKKGLTAWNRELQLSHYLAQWGKKKRGKRGRRSRYDCRGREKELLKGEFIYSPVPVGGGEKEGKGVGEKKKGNSDLFFFHFHSKKRKKRTRRGNISSFLMGEKKGRRVGHLTSSLPP